MESVSDKKGLAGVPSGHCGGISGKRHGGIHRRLGESAADLCGDSYSDLGVQ